MILSPLAEVARAVRAGDLAAAEKALDRLDDYGGQVAFGRAEASRAKTPPLPPLEVDSLALIAAEIANPNSSDRKRHENWSRTHKGRWA